MGIRRKALDMKICVQGLWHLGSVTAACLASLGFEVVGVDPSKSIVKELNEGKGPLFEPGLDDLIKKGLQNEKLKFVENYENALSGASILWVTFDTPVDEDDKADVDYVILQIKNILKYAERNLMVIVSSQLPVGSIALLEGYVNKEFPLHDIRFSSSPENLRLGKALDVFLNPDRIIVGVRSDDYKLKLEELFKSITTRIEWMSTESAEMTKHAINSFLATSVTFANEIASICEVVGADAKDVERGLKTEMRIGPKSYLSPGGPFAGGTLARDIEFLAQESRSKGLSVPLISSVKLSNDAHKNWIRRKVKDTFSDISKITFTLWGLTYKPGTDTLRRSLAVELCDWIINSGGSVNLYDPVVKEIPDKWLKKVKQFQNPLEALKNSNALIIGTEWPQFKDDAKEIESQKNKDLVIFDPNRHILNSINSDKLNYIAVGTPQKNIKII